MNHDTILAVLPDSKDDALSLKEIAQALGLEMNSYVDWIRAERRRKQAMREDLMKNECALVRLILQDGPASSRDRDGMIERREPLYSPRWAGRRGQLV